MQLATVDFAPTASAGGSTASTATAGRNDAAGECCDDVSAQPKPAAPSVSSKYSREEVHALRAVRSRQLTTLLTAELKRFRRAFAAQDSFRFFTSSLLIAVDALDLLVGAEAEVEETIDRHTDIIAAYEAHRLHRDAARRIRAQQQKEGRDRRRRRAQQQREQREHLRSQRQQQRLSRDDDEEGGDNGTPKTKAEENIDGVEGKDITKAAALSAAEKDAAGDDSPHSECSGYASDCSTDGTAGDDDDGDGVCSDEGSSCSSCSFSEGEDCGIGRLAPAEWQSPWEGLGIPTTASAVEPATSPPPPPQHREDTDLPASACVSVPSDATNGEGLQQQQQEDSSGAAAAAAAAKAFYAAVPHRRHRHNPLKDLFNVKVRMIDFAFTYPKQRLVAAGDPDGATERDEGYLLGVDSLIRLLREAAARREAEAETEADEGAGVAAGRCGEGGSPTKGCPLST